MEKTIDTHLFLDIIVSEGVTLLYCDNNSSEDIFEYYHGINGRKVCICVTDEFLTTSTAAEYLNQLGLNTLIDTMFFSSQQL